MDWFQQLAEHEFIDTVIITDNQGTILRSSGPISGQNELIASMIQAADVLAQSLTTELGRGPVQMLQITTDNEHILIFPLALSVYHLALIIRLEAPLASLVAELEQIIAGIDVEEFARQKQVPARSFSSQHKADDLNAQELIEAVREWLQNRSSGKDW